LDGHSWITHVRGLVNGDHELMQRLSTLRGWEQRRRWMYDRVVDEPRLTYCEVRYERIWSRNQSAHA
jgi:hypothetical protein